ncbi:hypothetical protein NUU61_006991 [Penicillium alfredii]|uniref:Tyrosine specific protein phosphatases domain-containing protein n=1 Tax=Penicillium alfredii TaxID=1506179 RepID=A0A9W9F222_9EURO|nr:uncharacterized protein NUU61_006991 [Penicillium alfredii]KAJ5092121.1 hypothetical protein NUU61_006991 [Penicillium alfredii]
MEKDDDLIPPRKDDPLFVYAIDENKGDLTCDVKYIVHLEGSESHHGGLILYRKIRLVRGRRSLRLHFIHYTAWPNSRAIGVEDMTSLIKAVNAKNVAGNPVFVNCLYGLGRTGTFIISREIYNVAQKRRQAGKDWFQQRGANGADPIEEYVHTLRIFRHDMVDNVRQFKFLYEWGNTVWQKVSGRGNKQRDDEGLGSQES